ncbi:MAG: MaoC family dehydratase [Candidatus Rokubacteria bacterium]|nr:MaoC family dehydratase [Candidatus Rokubacteria bacterium]
MAELLPEYRVKAVNTSTDSENKIHDDATAKRYGFAGGLVPGVTVYAYLTHPLAEGLGSAWLQRGTATVRFTKPVLDGEEVHVTGEITGRDPQQGLTATVRALTASGGECATLTATLPAGSPTPVNVAVYPEAPLPAERPAGTPEHLRTIDVLGTFTERYDAARAEEYLRTVSDALPLYRGAGAWVHPAFHTHLGNRVLRTNVIIGPWIHLGSVVRHLGPARVGATLSARAKVRSMWEKKGRDFIEVDMIVLADGKAVAHVLHSAIYRLPAPA